MGRAMVIGILVFVTVSGCSGVSQKAMGRAQSEPPPLGARSISQAKTLRLTLAPALGAEDGEAQAFLVGLLSSSVPEAWEKHFAALVREYETRGFRDENDVMREVLEVEECAIGDEALEIECAPWEDRSSSLPVAATRFARGVASIFRAVASLFLVTEARAETINCGGWYCSGPDAACGTRPGQCTFGCSGYQQDLALCRQNASNLAKNLISCQNSLSQANIQNFYLRDSLNQCELAKDSLQTQLNSCTGSLSSVNDALKVCNGTVSLLNADIALLKAQNADLTKQLADANATITNQTNQIAGLQSTIDSLRTLLQTASDELTACHASLDACQNDLEACRDELETNKRSCKLPIVLPNLPW